MSDDTEVDYTSRESKLERLSTSQQEMSDSEAIIMPDIDPEMLDTNDEAGSLSDLPAELPPGLHQNEAGEWVQRLKIDGVEIDQPYDAYRSQAQKYAAGDARLQRSVEFQNQLNAERQELDSRREALDRQQAQLSETMNQSPALPSDEDETSDVDSTQRAEDIVTSLFTGNREEAVKSVSELIALSSQPTPPSVNADELSETISAQAIQKIDDRQAQQAAADYSRAKETAYSNFANEFSEIVSDPALFEMADRETDLIVTEHPEWTPDQVMTEAGNRVRAQVVSAPASDEDPTQDDNDAQNRVTHKANLQPIPNVRTSATSKTPVVKEEDNSPRGVIARVRDQRRGIRNEI